MLFRSHEEKFGSELVFYGAIGYDNFFKGFLASFQVITFDDWAKIMYRMEDSNNFISSIFIFLTLVFFGSFFCLNLIVAVLVDTFQSNRAEHSDSNENTNMDIGYSIDADGNLLSPKSNNDNIDKFDIKLPSIENSPDE